MKGYKWRGYPIRKWENITDGCRLWDWEIKINGKWVEILTSSDKWDETEADQNLQNYLKKTNDSVTRLSRPLQNKNSH